MPPRGVTTGALREARLRRAAREGRSRHERPSVPMGRELPFARRERVDLERLGQLVGVELEADCRLVLDAARQRLGPQDRTRRHATDESLDLLQRFELLPERTARRRDTGVSARCRRRGR